jgi:hypothetical protein
MQNQQSESSTASSECAEQDSELQLPAKPHPVRPKEVGGPKGPEPTRYGDWEKAGRCSDF